MSRMIVENILLNESKQSKTPHTWLHLHEIIVIRNFGEKVVVPSMKVVGKIEE